MTQKEFDKLDSLCDDCVNFITLKVVRAKMIGSGFGTEVFERCKFGLPKFVSVKVTSCTAYEKNG